MPENIRALVVILIIASTTFFIATQSGSSLINRKEATSQRNLWLIIISLAFISFNFWVYSTLLAISLLFINKNNTNNVTIFFLLLCIVPTLSFSISGLGIINYLFDLSHQRILVLILLLPIFLKLLRTDKLKIGQYGTDKILLIYILLGILLYFRGSTITDTLRYSLYQFIDIILPYFVISRHLYNLERFRSALLYFLVSILIIASIGVFESFFHWLLYNSLASNWDLSLKFSGYSAQRAGVVRAKASVGTIPLGYLVAVGLGIYPFISHSIRKKYIRFLGWLVLLIGIIAPLSRGPWVGALFIVFIYVVTGKQVIKKLSRFTIFSIISLTLLSSTPIGTKIIDLLPMIGDTQQENISYRQQLIENSIQVIKENPIFGSDTYLKTEAMQEMRQGQGIIDIVNSYIRIALDKGLSGLFLFILFYLNILRNIHKSLKKIPTENTELRLLGRSLFATISGVLVIIFTVSSVSIIPWVYWCLAGLGMGYSLMVQNTYSETSEQISVSNIEKRP